MNIWDIVFAVLIAAALVAAIVFIRAKKSKDKGCCGCAGCSGNCSCCNVK